MKRVLFCAVAVVAVMMGASAFGQVADAPDGVNKGIPVNYTGVEGGDVHVAGPVEVRGRDDGDGCGDVDEQAAAGDCEVV